MKPLIFYQKVVEMRKHQKRWSQNHSYDALNKARAIEREIDAEIDRVQSIIEKKTTNKQLNLGI